MVLVMLERRGRLEKEANSPFPIKTEASGDAGSVTMGGTSSQTLHWGGFPLPILLSRVFIGKSPPKVPHPHFNPWAWGCPMGCTERHGSGPHAALWPLCLSFPKPEWAETIPRSWQTAKTPKMRPKMSLGDAWKEMSFY